MKSYNHVIDVMTTQRQCFIQGREADLQKEHAAAERRLSQYVMRYEMIEGYLQALCDIGKKEKGKKKVIAAMYRRAPLVSPVRSIHQ